MKFAFVIDMKPQKCYKTQSGWTDTVGMIFGESERRKTSVTTELAKSLLLKDITPAERKMTLKEIDRINRQLNPDILLLCGGSAVVLAFSIWRYAPVIKELFTGETKASKLLGM